MFERECECLVSMSVPWRVGACCRTCSIGLVLQCLHHGELVLACALCCSALQCVAVRCSVLQCVMLERLIAVSVPIRVGVGLRDTHKYEVFSRRKQGIVRLCIPSKSVQGFECI